MKHTELLPVPKGLVVRLTHVHDPKTLSYMALGKKPPKYCSVAMVVDRETGEILSEGFAFCSPKDNPSRKLGRVIAHNRAVTNLHDLWSA